MLSAIVVVVALLIKAIVVSKYAHMCICLSEYVFTHVYLKQSPAFFRIHILRQLSALGVCGMRLATNTICSYERVCSSITVNRYYYLSLHTCKDRNPCRNIFNEYTKSVYWLNAYLIFSEPLFGGIHWRRLRQFNN